MSTDEQNTLLQQQLAQLQAQLQEQQKQQATLFSLLEQQQQQQQQEQHMKDTSSHLPPPPRVKYEWTPSPELVSLMDMDHDLFVGTPLSDKQRSSLIDLYPPIAALDYRPPDAVPEAYGRMNEFQRSHDASLKSVQYLLSAVFRPLDLLAHQLLNNSTDVTAVQDSLKTLHDARALLLNASNSVNQYRNGIAIKAVNKAFKPDLSGDSRLTMPMDHFHSMISQLHSTQKTIREAQQFGKPKPFRHGPPSQHGGKTSNNQGSSNSNNNNSTGYFNNRFNQQRKPTQPTSNSNFSKGNNSNNRQ